MSKRLLFNLVPTQPGRSKRHGGGRYGEVVLKYIITHGYHECGGNSLCYYGNKRE